MGKKEDWEELEKWNNKRIQLESLNNPYAEDIDMDAQNKKVDRFINRLKVTGKVTMAFLILVLLLIIFIIGVVWDLVFADMMKGGIEPKEAIEGMYNTSVKLVYKDVDRKKDGKYIFKLSDNPEITFTVVKKYKSLSEDYADNCHKYYFEKWTSEKKKNFVVTENKDKGILEYNTYIEINTYEDLENGISAICDFIDYSGSAFFPSWEIYLKKGEYRIYPYQQNGTTREEAIKRAKEIFKNIEK